MKRIIFIGIISINLLNPIRIFAQSTYVDSILIPFLNTLQLKAEYLFKENFDLPAKYVDSPFYGDTCFKKPINYYAEGKLSRKNIIVVSKYPDSSSFIMVVLFNKNGYGLMQYNFELEKNNIVQISMLFADYYNDVAYEYDYFKPKFSGKEKTVEIKYQMISYGVSKEVSRRDIAI